MKTFKAKRGAMFGDEKAQLYGDRLDQLSEENNKEITPRIVVSDAKDKKSPLHDYFEWDNSKASEKYRLHQARMLISTITVIIETEDGDEEVRGYYNVTIEHGEEEEEERVYVTVNTVMSDDSFAQQVIEQAKKELVSWKKKYAQYKAVFGVVFDAIDDVIK